MKIPKQSDEALQILMIAFLREAEKDNITGMFMLKSAYYLGVSDGAKTTVWIAIAIVIFANILVYLIK